MHSFSYELMCNIQKWPVTQLNLEIKRLHKVTDFYLFLKIRAKLFIAQFFIFFLTIIFIAKKNKKLSDKYSHKLLDRAKQSTPDVLKTNSKEVIQETAGATENLIGNTIADKIAEVLKSSPQNSSKAVECETENTGFVKEIANERCMSPANWQQVIDKLR